MKLIKIREDSELAKLLKTESNLILDFYADWCGPCKVLSKTLQDVSSSGVFENVTVLKINVDNFSDVAKNYKVRSMPTLIFTSDVSGEREVLKTKVGNISKNDLQELLGSLYEQ